jgi:hypothetical protein
MEKTVDPPGGSGETSRRVRQARRPATTAKATAIGETDGFGTAVELVVQRCSLSAAVQIEKAIAARSMSK